MDYIIKSHGINHQGPEMFILTASLNGEYRWEMLKSKSKRFDTFGEARRLLNKILENKYRNN